MSWARRQARLAAPVRLPGAAGAGCVRPARGVVVERDLHQLVAALRTVGLMGSMCRGIRHGTLCVLVFTAVEEALAFLRIVTEGEEPCACSRMIAAVACTSTRTAVLFPAAAIAAVRARLAAAAP